MEAFTLENDYKNIHLIVTSTIILAIFPTKISFNISLTIKKDINLINLTIQDQS